MSNIKRRFTRAVLYIILFLPAYAHASLYADFYYVYTQAGNEGYVQGMGITVTNDLPYVLNLTRAMWYVSSSLSYGQKDADKPSNTSRFLLPITAGVYSDYTFSSYPFKVAGGIGCGAVYIRKYTPKHYGPYIDFSQTDILSNIGPRVEVIAGIYHIITQKISFFVKAGYHWTWFDAQYIENTIHGIIINCGLQLTLQGVNKGLFDE